MISPLFDTPLLLVERDLKVLVAADIHLGLEYELWLCGVSIPSQTSKILERLKTQIEKTDPDRLILLGDIKHNVPRTSWQEKREVPAFLKSLSELVRVDITPGNHDVGIAEMSPLGARVMPSSGYVLDGVGYFHGHTWPDDKLLQAEMLVAGHIHPALKLKEPIGCTITRRAWARTPLSADAVIAHYNREIPGPEMVIVPAFNDLCGGLSLNDLKEEDMHGPVMNLADLDRARISLLDGSDLGYLKTIKTAGKDKM